MFLQKTVQNFVAWILLRYHLNQSSCDALNKFVNALHFYVI